MTINYQSSYEEFREAYAATEAANKLRRGPVQRTLTFVLPAIAFWAAHYLLQSTSTIGLAPVFLHMLIAYGTIMITGIVLNLFNSVRTRRTALPLAQSLFSILVICGLIAEYVYLIIPVNRMTAGAQPVFAELLAPHVFWIVIIITTYISAITHLFRAQRASWEKRPSNHRPRTAEITGEGVMIFDHASRLQYAWTSFLRGAETKNLFLLYTAPANYEMLPKRAFAGEEELAAMRAMLRLIVPTTSAGFTVMPAAGDLK